VSDGEEPDLFKRLVCEVRKEVMNQRQFQRATCKGSYVLGTACGACERCAAELNSLEPGKPGYIAAMENLTAEPLQIPPAKQVRIIPCGKCGRDVQVNGNTVMAFCGDCTKGMGQKK